MRNVEIHIERLAGTELPFSGGSIMVAAAFVFG
jgi:hypothetical protein